MKNRKGFTLIELLVVVLIIGILAAIALPQYRIAVTKSKVASILPLMRRWKDALMEYNLQYGDYDVSDATALGVNWPSDWGCGDSLECESSDGHWYCFPNEEPVGYVYCQYDSSFTIAMYQENDEIYENFRGMLTCQGWDDIGKKLCKSLGKNLIEDNGHNVLYQL